MKKCLVAVLVFVFVLAGVVFVLPGTAKADSNFSASFDDASQTAIITGFTGSDTDITIPGMVYDGSDPYTVIGIAGFRF